MRNTFARMLITTALCLCGLISRAAASGQNSGSPPAGTSTDISAALIYTLPPDKLAKAKTLTKLRILDYLGASIWTLAALLILLQVHVFSQVRDFAERTISSVWLQGLMCLPAFLVILFLLALPFHVLEHYVHHSFGLSVQNWRSWIWDETKSLIVTCVIGMLVLSLVFFIIRCSPGRWWLWNWIASIPILVFFMFIAPLILDPLFHGFEPLAQSNPELVAQIERAVAKGGLAIPPSRMFLMDASRKETTINAYVTGVGASARVVVWDTALQKATPEIVLWIFGHEMGHYVLHHIRNTLLIVSVILFFVAWFGQRMSYWLIAHWGVQWQVRSEQDWAAFGIYALVLTAFGLLLTPCLNSYSRMIEHTADVYSMEVMHGVVSDPQASGVRAFKLLGEQALADPAPSPLVVFFLYSHPSISERVAFVSAYDPWTPGQKPKYFRKPA
jgi:STE24 endopeptidase